MTKPKSLPFEVIIRWDPTMAFLVFYQNPENEKTGAYFYDIDASSINTPAGLNRWIEHLSQKNWFGEAAEVEFRRLAAEAQAAKPETPEVGS